VGRAEVLFPTIFLRRVDDESTAPAPRLGAIQRHMPRTDSNAPRAFGNLQLFAVDVRCELRCGGTITDGLPDHKLATLGARDLKLMKGIAY